MKLRKKGQITEDLNARLSGMEGGQRGWALEGPRACTELEGPRLRGFQASGIFEDGGAWLVTWPYWTGVSVSQQATP